VGDVYDFVDGEVGVYWVVWFVDVVCFVGF